MKALLAIVGVSLLVFLLVGGLQEWRVFARDWLGLPDPSSAAASDEDREAAVGAVRELLTIAAHLYASGGDERFAERLPASDGIIEEIRDNVDYLARNGRRSAPTLVEMSVLAVEPAGRDRMTIRTRETWRHRTFWVIGGGSAAPDDVQTLHLVYRLARQGTRWLVLDWDLEPEPPPEDGAERT